MPSLRAATSQGALGGVALHEPAPVAIAERRVVGERRGAQRPFERVAVRGRGIDRLAFDREFALGDVAAAADLDQRIGGGDGAHGHFVARERAGLVGADDGCGPERFDRRQLAHDGMGRRHAADAEAEPDCDDRRQRLRNGRDRQRHGEQEQAEHDVEGEGRGAEEPGGEHHRANAQHDHAEPLAGPVQFLLQRRRLLFGGVQEPGDPTDLGRHAGGDDHRAPAAVGGDGAGKEHVAAVAEAARRLRAA